MLANEPMSMTRGEPAAAVWIVDDDRSIRWVLEKALSREGIPFRSFASAQEAAQALQHDQPQVLVSDIRMPGETGLELLASIKARHPRLPVDRKSTRLNSSHQIISYAVFCLKTTKN